MKPHSRFKAPMLAGLAAASARSCPLSRWKDGRAGKIRPSRRAARTADGAGPRIPPLLSQGARCAGQRSRRLHRLGALPPNRTGSPLPAGAAGLLRERRLRASAGTRIAFAGASGFGGDRLGTGPSAAQGNLFPVPPAGRFPCSSPQACPADGALSGRSGQKQYLWHRRDRARLSALGNAPFCPDFNR